MDDFLIVSRRFDAVVIEKVGDGRAAVAVQIEVENAPDDRRLFLDHNDFVGVVAVDKI